jgi:hypothetical protein
MDLSLRESKKQRRALDRERDRAHRDKARALLASLRAAIRTAKLDRKLRTRAVVEDCRTHRARVRAEAKAKAAQLRAELRANAAEQKRAAREQCSHEKRRAKIEGADRVDRADRALTAERQYQAELRRIEQGNRLAKLDARRSSAAERRSESDDEVRANLAPEHLALFERVKRSIKGSGRASRTEAFLRYVEEHPAEVIASLDDVTEARIREMEARERSLSRSVAKARHRYTPAELAAVPF